MDNQFREALCPIHATEEMKQHTRSFLQSRLAAKPGKRRSPLRYAAVCCAMLAVILCGFGGYRFYSAPVSYISVDVNPSVELGLNRLDRVVTVAAYNEDGATVLQNLSLKHKTYTQAIELLLADATFAGYLTEDAALSFTVVSEKEQELLTGIQQCHGYAQSNAECHGASTQLVEEAHHNGLSFGKYQAYLVLSQYDNALTVEDCKGLSMRQIRDLIRQYQSGAQAPSASAQGGGHRGCNGQGGGHGAGCNAK